jgi:hypothetical protein
MAQSVTEDARFFDDGDGGDIGAAIMHRLSRVEIFSVTTLPVVICCA